MRSGALADEIAAAEVSHLRGVRSASGNVAALAGMVDARFPVYGESHFTAQNDVSGFGRMGVRWIVRVWTIRPCVGVREAFALKLR